MTKPAARDVVVKVRSEPARSDSAPAGDRVPAGEAAPLAVPRPLPGLARPALDGFGPASGGFEMPEATPGGFAELPGSQPDPAGAVARLRRQAGRRESAGSGPSRPATELPRSRTLDELHRRAGTVLPLRAPAGRPAIRRQVVTQLRLGGERRDRISSVAIVGRPPNTFGGSMGDHTTAFTVHVNAVQQALENAPLAEAAVRLGVLVSELRSLPGYPLVGELLPPRHLRMWQAALATITDVRRRLDAAAGDVGLIQQYIGAYLELRELVPLSTVNTGTVSKATSGKGKGEAVAALREQAAGRPQKPEDLAREILGLFDVRAAALACAEIDPIRLAVLAPGLPADRGPRERGHLIVLQHLRSIQTGYPGALAALAGEKVAEVASGSDASAAEVAAARRAAAQEADTKVLGRLIEEILSNHVMPRMVTVVLGELHSLQADQARDVAALQAFQTAGSDRALNSGKTGKKAEEEKARIGAQLALTEARIKALTAVLGSDSVFAAKPSGSGIGKADPKSAAKPGSGDGMDSSPRPAVDGSTGSLAGGRGKRKRRDKVDIMEESRLRVDQQRHEQALEKFSKASGRSGVRSGRRGRKTGTGARTGHSAGLGSESGSGSDEQGGKRARTGDLGLSAQQVWAGIAKLGAGPVFGGSDPVPEPESVVEEPQPPPLQTVQVVLDDAGNVAEVRAAGRPASPFRGSMGAHTTAWTVHVDRVRAALVGKSVAVATAALEGPLRVEREASAAAMGRAFEFRNEIPAPSVVAAGPASLTRLQELVVAHLERVNLIPGATLPSVDTGGKGEGRHRRVLQNPGKHPPAAVRDAVLGMIDVAGLVNGTALAQLRVADGAAPVLVRQHLAAVRAAYPGALERAEINPDSAAVVAGIVRTINAREPSEPAKPGSRKPAVVLDDDDESAEEPSGSLASGPVPLTLDDKLFGAHKPPAEPGAALGRPESALAPLLGAPGVLVRPAEADRAAAALWLDPAGNLLDARLDEFVTAYTADIAEGGTYLAEGEGTVAADHFGIRVRVYRDAAPPEFEARDNPGGGDCLLHALSQVSQAARGVPVTRALPALEITAARQAIRAGLPLEAARNAVRTIVTDAVAQRHTAGLGPRMRELLGNAGFRHATAWVRTARQREADEARLKAKADPPKPASPAKKDPPPALPPGPVVIRRQAVYGGNGEDAGALADQALLHTGGNHYVALIRRAPVLGADPAPRLGSSGSGIGSSGSGPAPARPPSSGSPSLSMVPLPSLASLLLASYRPPTGTPPTTGTPAQPPPDRR